MVNSKTSVIDQDCSIINIENSKKSLTESNYSDIDKKQAPK